MKGSGLGYALMSEIIDYARATGIRRVFGDVLRENDRMLRMAREFGFAVRPAEAGSEAVIVELTLEHGTNGAARGGGGMPNG